MPLAKPQAVVFDLDGVLILSSPVHAAAYCQVLAERLGIEDFDYAPYAGMSTDASFRLLLGERGLDCDEPLVDELTRAKRRAAAQALRECRPVHPAAEGLLAGLQPRYPLALATSASPGTASLFLEDWGFGRFFRAVVRGDQVAAAKPAPDIYLETASRLGLPPGDCLAVEDSASGVRATVAAGMPVVGVASAPSGPDLAALGAELVIADLAELWGLLLEP